MQALKIMGQFDASFILSMQRKTKDNWLKSQFCLYCRTAKFGGKRVKNKKVSAIVSFCLFIPKTMKLEKS